MISTSERDKILWEQGWTYTENDVLTQTRPSRVTEKSCKHIFDRYRTQGKAKVLWIKNISIDVHKTKKFSLNHNGFFFFPLGEALRLRLTKHYLLWLQLKAQLMGTDAFYFVIFWVYSFDSLFTAPEESRVSPFTTYICFHDNTGLIFLGKHLKGA